jgi:hypothetical protein
MAMVDLRADAAAEVCRATRTRTSIRDGDERALAQLEGDGPWVVRARRTNTRQALGACFVFVWRVAYEDAAGRLLESRLVPLAVEMPCLAGARRPRSWTKSLVRALESWSRPCVEAASAGWQQEAERTVRRLAATRSARDQAIASSTTRLDGVAYQPGLFDRRAERQRSGDAASTAEADQMAADHLAALDRLAFAQQRPPQLLLVITP